MHNGYWYTERKDIFETSMQIAEAFVKIWKDNLRIQQKILQNSK